MQALAHLRFPHPARTCEQLPAELPHEDVQLKSLMLFERDLGVPADPTLAERATAASDKAAQAAQDSLQAEAEALAAEQAAAETQPDELIAVAAATTLAVQPAAIPVQPSANGRTSAAQTTI